MSFEFRALRGGGVYSERACFCCRAAGYAAFRAALSATRLSNRFRV